LAFTASEHAHEIDRYFAGTLWEPIEVLFAFNEREEASSSYRSERMPKAVRVIEWHSSRAVRGVS